MGSPSDLIRTLDPLFGETIVGPKDKNKKLPALSTSAKKSPTLQSARSRDERLQASRGRSSFRIDLLDSDDRSTRTGISLN